MAKRTARDDELSTRPRIKKKLLDLYKDIEEGYIDQRERADDTADYWDCYNEKLGGKQFYQGNSQIFLPIVPIAVNARKTRFCNQIFPRSGRYIEAIGMNGDTPQRPVALLERYVDTAKLRTEIMPALCKSGDIEGQYSIYAGWSTTERYVVSRETKPVEIDGMEYPEQGEVETIFEETIEDAGPFVEVIHDSDLLVLPATSDSIEQALDRGGSVTLIRRWSKARIKQAIEEGEIDEPAGKSLMEAMDRRQQDNRKDVAKDLVEAAGIRAGGKYSLIYETWTKLKVDGKQRLCKVFYGGEKRILGAKLNPYWCDRCPVLSVPVEKIPGAMKGRSLLAGGTSDLQFAANDTMNEMVDNGHYSMMPITVTDPVNNPNWANLVMDVGAVWPVNPQNIKFMEFPDKTEQGMVKIAAFTQTIFQKLSVNPSMIPQSSGNKTKRNQAEIVLEQSVDLLTTADAVTVLEQGILTPLVQRFMEYDHQYRDTALAIPMYGEFGVRLQMEEVPPLQMNTNIWLRWLGVEAARNASQIQQQIAALNVARGIPKEMYKGYELNVVPVLKQIFENALGPRIAPLVFVSPRDQLSIDAKLENEMLAAGFAVPVHPMDDDPKHLQEHMKEMAKGDPHGTIQVHMQQHQQQMQAKNAMAMMQAMQGQPGVPGGAGPGVAGTPRPGAQPGVSRMKGFPGSIHQDRLPSSGGLQMPRKT
ncbi:MAG TPA: hypothetical protein VEU47_19105 [Candidatus Cybelea sp.]|nr:hypothetical protein [Candidatus Cybelea sp.]